MAKLVPGRIVVVLKELYTWCRGMFYLSAFRGSEHTCPFCKHSFSRFLPVGYKHPVLKEKKIVGGGYRKNAECPFCASTDRERLVYLFIRSRDLVQPGMRVLHIAPEKNLQKIIKQKNTTYYAADLDSPLANITMDIQDIQFPENYFDAIICNHVLEHITDDLKAMKELYRVLKKNGWAILQVPYSPIMDESFEDSAVTGSREREKVFGQNNHVRIYGLDYPLRLQSAGFSVSLEKMDAYVTGEFALNPEEHIFFCKK